MDLSKGQFVVKNEIIQALHAAGYRPVNFVKFPRDYCFRKNGDGEELDIFLKENRTMGVRLFIDSFGEITSLYSFDVKSGQNSLPIADAKISAFTEIRKKPTKANVTYYHGLRAGGITFAILRGDGLDAKEVKALIRSAGFEYHHQMPRQRNRMFGWYSEIYLFQLVALLTHIQSLGYNVKPSDTLPAKKRLNLQANKGAWQSFSGNITAC